MKKKNKQASSKIQKTKDKFTLAPDSLVFHFNKVNKEVGDFVNPVYDFRFKEPYKSEVSLVGYGQGTVWMNQILSPSEYKELQRLMKKIQKALAPRCDKKFSQTVTHKNKKVIDVDTKTIS